jgi:hypothetical protein
MLLAFGTFGNDVTTEHPVGTVLHADVHWYPGASPLRALVGRLHDPARVTTAAPPAGTVAEAAAAVGWSIAAEPWLERAPACVSATPVPLGNGRWSLADDTGSVPIVPGFWRTAELVALSGGRPLTVMGEWSSDGFMPLTLWASGHAVAL